MLTIAPIPLEEEIKRIQQLRIQELSMKIERDRRLAQEAFERFLPLLIVIKSLPFYIN